MASSYRRALDTAITAMMREAIEHSAALEQVLGQVNQLVTLRVRLGHNGLVAGEVYRDALQRAAGAGVGGEPRSQAAPLLQRLTPREHEVLGHLVRGSSNRQIARSLGISERTVKNHLRAVFTKLEVADRTSAAVKALTAGRAPDEQGGGEPGPVEIPQQSAVHRG
ncbi:MULTISPECIES: LuxR C-terminal-related transcriptional regulator [unclassified Saccharopolyspora]|uniref:helix-turn-helix transcriptional regulator n=1 Tax=unclassified Saccharopolyspora TaxID=2646250 RepID=UPI001CD74060|nr:MULTISPECIES: LuxR C-terminal-related transcriptional regulator [unclassified Saccharopolyspora]MCA1186247.1 LuxR C-terminal-related transcriptional regulator [Saccharopolyspora sp. 6T]MCA1192234.1 LuxR C-terminal-related transcriptional regulator [Saccharopolyspora sp. 6V]MCA1227561.1 LuxR C-terminal-related transcriptional regulator [Saccharopolyspora sp. 6M]